MRRIDAPVSVDVVDNASVELETVGCVTFYAAILGRARFIMALSVSVAVAGCGTDQQDAGRDNASATGTQSRATIVRSSRCLDVDGALLRHIIDPESTGPIPLTDGQAVKARGFDNVYFVAAYFHENDRPDLTGIGIWWTDRLDDEAGFWSVNDHAHEISDWGSASNAKPPDPVLSIYSDGAEDSSDCVAAKRAGG